MAQMPLASVSRVTPGNGFAVIEAQEYFHVYLDFPTAADDDAHQIGQSVANRHEIDDRDGARRRLPVCLEDHPVFAVCALRARIRIDRRDAPAPVVACSEQCGEACAGIEARPAQPVDGTIPPDERGRFAVADECVIPDIDSRTANVAYRG